MKFPAARNGISSIVLQMSLQAAENLLYGIDTAMAAKIM
jgi:hypothetical protein